MKPKSKGRRSRNKRTIQNFPSKLSLIDFILPYDSDQENDASLSKFSSNQNSLQATKFAEKWPTLNEILIPA